MRRSSTRSLMRLLSDRSGVAALEMAFAGTLASGLFVATLAVVVGAILQVELDRTTHDAARLLQTGQIRAQADDKDGAVKEALCRAASGIVSCASLTFTLTPVKDFTNPTPLPAGRVVPGVVSSLMLMQTQYQIGVKIGPLQLDGLSSSAAFRIEN